MSHDPNAAQQVALAAEGGHKGKTGRKKREGKRHYELKAERDKEICERAGDSGVNEQRRAGYSKNRGRSKGGLWVGNTLLGKKVSINCVVSAKGKHRGKHLEANSRVRHMESSHIKLVPRA